MKKTLSVNLIQAEPRLGSLIMFSSNSKESTSYPVQESLGGGWVGKPGNQEVSVGTINV